MKAARVGATLLAEVAALDTLYGLGVSRDGSLIHAVVWLLWLAIVLVTGGVVGRSTGYIVGGVLSVVGFFVAMVIAVNIWGT
jgi:hypothetical protein